MDSLPFLGFVNVAVWQCRGVDLRLFGPNSFYMPIQDLGLCRIGAHTLHALSHRTDPFSELPDLRLVFCDVLFIVLTALGLSSTEDVLT